MLTTKARLSPSPTVARRPRCARLVTPMYYPMQYAFQQGRQRAKKEREAQDLKLEKSVMKERKLIEITETESEPITPSAVEEKQMELSAPEGPCMDIVRRGNIPAIIFRNGVVTVC